jgi:serine/threonine-protein kinase
MSPEQALGKDQLDARADLYALGAIAYHMLSGHPPFQGETPMEVMFAHARQDVTPMSGENGAIPADLERVVLRCLQKSPDSRYADASELERALAACSSAADWDAAKAALWWHGLCCQEAQAV